MGNALLNTLRMMLLLSGIKPGRFQRSAQYQAVQLGSRPQCSTDPPVLTQTVRSRVDCSKQCVGQDGESCAAFNFKQSQSRCELFGAAEIYNYTEIPGCTLFEVRKLILNLLTKYINTRILTLL
jgi:hypothetical protein